MGETSSSLDDPAIGLWLKYEVRWKPGREQEIDLDLFVLDLFHDLYATGSIRVYGIWAQRQLTQNEQPYTVQRNNDPDGKHLLCNFWVLNATTDKPARMALRHYIEECKEAWPLLSQDLMEMVRRNSPDGEEEEYRRWNAEV